MKQKLEEKWEKEKNEREKKKEWKAKNDKRKKERKKERKKVKLENIYCTENKLNAIMLCLRLRCLYPMQRVKTPT